MDDTTPQPKNEMDQNDTVSSTNHHHHNNNTTLIDSFCEITSSSKQEALFFLESHQWDLDSALSTFLDDHHHHHQTSAAAGDDDDDDADVADKAALHPVSASPSPSESHSPDYSPSQSRSPSRSRSRSRSRSSSPVPARYQLRSRRGGDKKTTKKKKKAEASGSGRSRPRGGVRTLADLKRSGGDSGRDHDDHVDYEEDGDDDDDYQPQEYYAGGERSGMLVQDPNSLYDADAVFDHAQQSGGNVGRPTRRSSSRSFTGTGRLLSGETVQSAPQPSEAVNHTVTLWRNGFTVNDGPLRRFNDPANASFLESIKNSECPKELEPADRRTQVHLEMVRREENYSEPKRKRQTAFQGKGKTLGGGSNSTTMEDSKPAVNAPSLAAPPAMAGLVVDYSLPTTSIQLRLADGTRMVSRFNLTHTIRDVRGFLDASKAGGERNYQLQTMDFPPKQLTDPDQTIEEAGIASSVVIQRF